MRASVCEFLRQSTKKNWFYASPGNWSSDRLRMRAERDERGRYLLFKGKAPEPFQTLTYFEGLPHIVIRDRNRRPNKR